jgi:hypothetical protein
MKNTLALVLMVFGCFGAIASSGYELVDYQDPKVDEQGEFYIGDVVFVSTSGYIKPCIIPTKEFKNTTKVLGTRYTWVYKRDTPICKVNIKDKYYKPEYFNYLIGGGVVAEQTFKKFVSIKKTKKGLKICQRLLNNQGCVKELSSTDLRIEDKYFVHSAEYPIKSISYLGKSKGLLKFSYELTLNSFYNPIYKTHFGGDSQTIQFEVDPAESNVFSFKGALFEIIDSSSSSITIKVIRDFPK